MTYFPDMGTATMIDVGNHIRAVGWLHADRPFSQGPPPPDFVTRLREFAQLWWPSTEALGWGLFMGGHRCEFCHNFGAGGNFGVPDGDLLFAAPEMIAHYVEHHQYCPPNPFIVAVLNSPLPDTPEYRKAVEPFRVLHQGYIERCQQRSIARAAAWARDNGADDKAMQEAGSRFLGNSSPEMCERIRQAMNNSESGRGT
jgi:hypothetical protein